MIEARHNENKSVNAEPFSDYYHQIEGNIKKCQAQKEELSKVVQNQTLKYDISKRKYLSRLAIINERNKIFSQKKKEMNCNDGSIDDAFAANKEANESNEKILEEINKLKKNLEKKYSEIAKTLNSANEVVTNHGSEQKLIKISIDRLNHSICSRNNNLMKSEDVYSMACAQLTLLQRKHQDLLKQKDVIYDNELKIDARRMDVLQIMSEPLDSLTYEESIIKDIEQDVETLEKRLNTESKIGSKTLDQCEVDFANDRVIILGLENENAKRKTFLDEKKSYLDQFKNDLASNQKDVDISPQSTSSNNRIQFSNIINDDESELRVNEISQRLHKKQKELNDEEKAIDEISAKNASTRKQVMLELDIKTHKIEELNKNLHEIELYLVSINEIIENIDEGKQTSRELETKIAQIKRRMDNVERDKNFNKNNNKALLAIQKRYEEHKREIEENEERLNEMREEFNELQNEVNELDEKHKQRESEVIALEDKLKTVEATISKTVDNLHEEEGKLDELLKKIPANKQVINDHENISVTTESY